MAAFFDFSRKHKHTNEPRVFVTFLLLMNSKILFMKSFVLDFLDPTFTVANACRCASSTGWSSNFPLQNNVQYNNTILY